MGPCPRSCCTRKVLNKSGPQRHWDPQLGLLRAPCPGEPHWVTAQHGSLPLWPSAPQQSENLRELMFILVTPMSLSGVERLKEEASGESQKRSDSSSRSSSS